LSRGGRRRDGAFREAKYFRSIVGLLMFEHTKHGVQEFALDGDEGLHFLFPSSQKVFIKTPQVRIVPDGDEGRHVKISAQVAIAGLRDADFFMHGSAGRIFARIESGVGDPLTNIEQALTSVLEVSGLSGECVFSRQRGWRQPSAPLKVGGLKVWNQQNGI
jgi:hypothetical protein